VLLAGGVAEPAACILHREQPLQPPADLVEQVGNSVARLGDVPVVVGRGEIGGSELEPEERGVERGAVEREVAGVVPAAAHTGWRERGVARVDPRTFGVGRLDGGERALEVEGTLDRAHRIVEHLPPTGRDGSGARQPPGGTGPGW
jgi:hypothetical protein